jgi:hypothetical protein
MCLPTASLDRRLDQGRLGTSIAEASIVTAGTERARWRRLSSGNSQLDASRLFAALSTAGCGCSNTSMKVWLCLTDSKSGSVNANDRTLELTDIAVFRLDIQSATGLPRSAR